MENHGDATDANPARIGPWAGRDLFRFVLLALLIGQMLVYYDTATKAIPHINVYLLVRAYAFSLPRRFVAVRA